MNSKLATHPVPAPSTRTLARRRWLVVLAAMAAAVAAWTIAHPLLNIDLLVEDGSGSTRQVSHLAVTLSSLFAGLVGWAVLGTLERLTARAHLVWRVLASLVFVVSLAGPFSAVSNDATVVLLGLHCLVAGILIVGLPPAGGREPTR